MSALFKDYTFSMLEKNDVDRRAVQDINMLLEQLGTERRVEDEDELRWAIERDMTIVIVKHGSAIIGMGIASREIKLGRYKDDCKLDDIVVDAQHCGKGIGGEILSRLCRIARERYIARYINLTSSPGRESANRLYLKRGFKLRETNVYRFALSYE